MAGIVYLICALTALLCCNLLLRSYRRNRVSLLLWCGLFFLGLALENLLVFVDLILVPHQDLSGVGLSAALAGSVLLLYGLIWEVK